MGVVGGFLVPASPVLVPEVGRGREREAVKTIAALRRAGRLRREARPDALIVLLAGDGSAAQTDVPNDGSLRRPFSRLDSPELERADAIDGELTAALAASLSEAQAQPGDPQRQRGESCEWPEEALAGLYFLAGATDLPVALVRIPRADLEVAERAGRAIARAVEQTGRRAALTAVGELSSRVFPGAPGGYHPNAVAFDGRVLSLLEAGDLAGLRAIAPADRADAGESALPQLVALLAAITPSLPPALLSYEAPFGVGYIVAGFLPGPPASTG